MSKESGNIVNKLNLLSHLGNIAQMTGGLTNELDDARVALQKSLAQDIKNTLKGNT